MHRFPYASICVAVALLACRADAQCFNVEFGTPGTPPPADYAAAGLSGAWNTFGVLSNTPQPIVNIFGVNTGVTIKNIGGTAIISADDRATSAGDELLVDDMLISLCNPLDACLYFANLQNGTYEVLIYAKTPNSPSINNVRVDFADQGNQLVGGTWPGEHQESITYARFTITTSNGKIDFHSGLFNGNFQSGLNGVQIRRLVTGDLNGDQLVNEIDRSAFCSAIGSAAGEDAYDMYADLNEDGVIDHLDQQMFNDLLPPCEGDVVSNVTFAPPPDGVTDAADLAFLLGAWGNQPSCADFVSNRTFAPPPDGKVDGADLAFLLGSWGRCE
jgi:hypothetical protein